MQPGGQGRRPTPWVAPMLGPSVPAPGRCTPSLSGEPRVQQRETEATCRGSGRHGRPRWCPRCCWALHTHTGEDGDAEAQRGEGTCPRPHSQSGAGVGFELRADRPTPGTVRRVAGKWWGRGVVLGRELKGSAPSLQSTLATQVSPGSRRERSERRLHPETHLGLLRVPSWPLAASGAPPPPERTPLISSPSQTDPFAFPQKRTSKVGPRNFIFEIIRKLGHRGQV